MFFLENNYPLKSCEMSGVETPNQKRLNFIATKTATKTVLNDADKELDKIIAMPGIKVGI